MMSSCVRTSVRHKSGVLSKRLNESSWFWHANFLESILNRVTSKNKGRLNFMFFYCQSTVPHAVGASRFRGAWPVNTGNTLRASLPLCPSTDSVPRRPTDGNADRLRAALCSAPPVSLSVNRNRFSRPLPAPASQNSPRPRCQNGLGTKRPQKRYNGPPAVRLPVTSLTLLITELVIRVDIIPILWSSTPPA